MDARKQSQQLCGLVCGNSGWNGSRWSAAKSRNLWARLCPCWDVYRDFASQFQIMQRRIPVRNLLIILAVVAVSFFLLLTVVSQSLAVLFATLLGCTMGVVLDGQ